MKELTLILLMAGLYSKRKNKYQKGEILLEELNLPALLSTTLNIVIVS